MKAVLTRFHRLLPMLLIAACGFAPAQVAVSASVQLVREGAERASIDQSNMAIWLTPISGSAQAVASNPPVQRDFVLNQRNKNFSPHLLLVPVGAAVSFPNHDPVFHNVFSLFEGKRFDLGLYEAGHQPHHTL